MDIHFRNADTLNSTPVSAASPLPVNPSQGMLARIMREGDEFSGACGISGVDLTSASFAGAGYYLGGPMGSSFTVGHAYFVTAIWLSGNKNWFPNLQVNLAAVTGQGSGPGGIAMFAPLGPGQVLQPLVAPLLLRGGRDSGMSLYTRTIQDADKTNCYLGGSVAGYRIGDDLNFDATKVALFFGTSLWNGTGPSSKDTFLPWMITRFYRDQGIDVRMVMKAISGVTWQGQDNYRGRGLYDFNKNEVTAIFIDLDTNDAGQGLSLNSVTMPAFNDIVAWGQKRYPNAKKVVLGSPPLNNNTSQTNLQAIQTAQAAAVAALNDPNVLYYSQINAFDRTNLANYNSSDGVHPVDAAINLNWNGGYNGNAGLKAWLAANLPLI